ncbi:MAG TPA: hypothetical protein PLC98_15840 [Anaerolineales bacterium]|nr:hypothetical protein [Anaerolineales bacterium]
MAATGVITSRDYKIEYSPNGTTGWLDWSGFVSKINFSGGDVQVGKFQPLDTNRPILYPGKSDSLKATMSVVYTEVVTESYEVLRLAQRAGTGIFFRWSPRGGQTTELQYTSQVAYVTGGADMPPSVDASSAAIVALDVTVEFSDYAVAAVA